VRDAAGDGGRDDGGMGERLTEQGFEKQIALQMDEPLPVKAAGKVYCIVLYPVPSERAEAFLSPRPYPPGDGLED